MKKNESLSYKVLNVYKKYRYSSKTRIILYSRCIDCSFEKFETIYKEELNDLLEVLIRIHLKKCYLIV